VGKLFAGGLRKVRRALPTKIFFVKFSIFFGDLGMKIARTEIQYERYVQEDLSLVENLLDLGEVVVRFVEGKGRKGTFGRGC